MALRRVSLSASWLAAGALAFRTPHHASCEDANKSTREVAATSQTVVTRRTTLERALEKKDELGAYLTAPPSVISTFAICFPNAYMLWQHKQGKTAVLINFILRTVGVRGLFLLPWVGLAMEKSFYDTAMAIQGIDANEAKPGRENEGFPSGGRLLPNLSIVPVWKKGE